MRSSLLGNETQQIRGRSSEQQHILRECVKMVAGSDLQELAVQSRCELLISWYKSFGDCSYSRHVMLDATMKRKMEVVRLCP